MESGLSDRRDVELGSADALADRVAALLREYRQDFAAEEEERRRLEPCQALKKPFELLEVAYQMASHLVMAMLAPSVHPIVPWLTRLLMRRDYPQELLAPCWTVLVSGLHAKLVLDMANFWGCPPFRWMRPRPRRAELLHPFGSLSLQLNLLSSVAGVGLGRSIVALRQGLEHLLQGPLSRLPPCVRGAAGLRVRWAAWLALHLSVSLALAPVVVSGLSHVLLDAQLLRRPLLPTAVRSALAKLSDELPLLLLGASRRDGAPFWDGALEDQVPGDLLCPITGGLFVHPATLHGMVFERSAAEQWVRATGRHPVLQNVWCHVGELRPAQGLEAICHRFAAERGWRLCAS